MAAASALDASVRVQSANVGVGECCTEFGHHAGVTCQDGIIGRELRELGALQQAFGNAPRQLVRVQTQLLQVDAIADLLRDRARQLVNAQLHLLQLGALGKQLGRDAASQLVLDQKE